MLVFQHYTEMTAVNHPGHRNKQFHKPPSVYTIHGHYLFRAKHMSITVVIFFIDIMLTVQVLEDNIIESQNHKMVWVGGTLKII